MRGGQSHGGIDLKERTVTDDVTTRQRARGKGKSNAYPKREPRLMQHSDINLHSCVRVWYVLFEREEMIARLFRVERVWLLGPPLLLFLLPYLYLSPPS